MNIFDAHISGSLSVSSSAEISGNLNVLGTLSGSFEGDGSQLTNIPASGVTGLNLTQIADGTATASISQVNGFNVNTNINVSGSILPSVHVGENVSTYSLGSPTNAWHHLYISTGSIKFVNELGQEQGRITINPNSGQFNILSTSGLTESEITQIEAGNIPSSSLTDINIKSLNVYENIFASGSVTSSVFTGSFIGDGTNLYNIPASGVTGLNLTRIADGATTASVSNTNGFRINSNTEITGALKLNKVDLGTDDIVEITVTDSGGKFFINGVRNPKLEFIRGLKYKFLYSNFSQHPFKFSITDNGTHNGGTEYTTGVTMGYSPDYIQIEVTDSTPSTLHYFCGHHVGMGNSITIYSDFLHGQANIDLIKVDTGILATTGSNTFIGNQNISGSLGVTGSVSITGSITLNGQPIGTGKLDEVTFNSYTSSNDSTNSTQNDRLTSIETSTGSLNTFSSSIDTTIKNKLNSDSVISGSVQVHVTGTTGYSTFSSSISTSIDSLSSSVATTTNNLSSSVATTTNNLSSSVATTTNNLSSSVATTTLNLKNRVDSVETSTGSLNSFTSSINTTIKDKMNADGVLSGSITFDISVIPGFTGLTNTVSSSISSSVSELSGSLTVTVTNLSSSLTNTDENQNNRIIGLETASGSLNSFTSSINTTIKSKLNTEGVISGSLQVNLTDTTGYNTFSSSVATTTSNLSSSVDSLSSSVATTTLNLKNRVDSIENKTGSYATTGSNIFQGSQTITGSLYVSQDLIVAGSSSIQHISSSIVNIADNIITVNASNPSLRFGGLAVIDSGSSPQVSGSILFDSIENQWVFIHQNQASVTSSMLIMGPETYDNVGNETHLTLNRLVKSVNDEHIGDSNITDTGTKVSINSNTEVTGTLNVTGIITNPNITAIETSTGSLNTFTSSLLTAIELTGSNLTVRGNFLVKGTTTNVNTTTLDVDNNLINLNGNGASFAGIRVKDTTGPILVSGSLLWDSANDYWIAGQLGSEQRLVRETEFNNAVTRIGNVETSTGSLNSFTGSINTTIKTKLNTEGVISGSVQVNHNATTNYDSNQHVDHTAVSISTGNGLSGGGTIATTRTLTLDTDSTHFTNGVKSKMNTDGVISGSAQIDGSLLGSNKTITIGSTSTTLGGTSTSLAGLTSVTSTAFTGSIQGYATSETLSTVTGRGASTTNRITITATGVGGTPLLSLGVSNAASFVHGQETFAPNLTSTQAVINPIGVAGSTKNAGYIGYKYSGTGGSNDNLLTFGHWGADHLMTMNGAGNVSITGTVSASNLSGTNTGDETLARVNALAITTVGTITSGTWNGSVIGSSYGGAGTVNGLMKSNGSGTVSAATAGTDYVAPSATFFIGTTSITHNRSTASQTLTGVSIDGNSATVTNGVYTTGDQTIAGVKTFSGRVVVEDTVGEIILSPTGWRDTNRAEIKIKSKSDVASELDFRRSQGGREPGWHFSARGSAESGDLYIYRFDQTGAGVPDTSSFVLMYQFKTNGTLVASTFSGALSGNATTATTLQTTRSIYGNNFNGSADVTGTISNAYLTNSSFNIGTTSISLGRASASQTLSGVSIDGNSATTSQTNFSTLTLNSSTVKSFGNSSYSTTFSSVSSVTVTHSLGTKDVAVFVYDSSDNMFWPSSIVTTSTSVVTVTFASSRSGRVVVVR